MARFARQTERSGEAGRKRGVGKMNARPALAFAAAEFRANEVGTPQTNISQVRLEKYWRSIPTERARGRRQGKSQTIETPQSKSKQATSNRV